MRPLLPAILLATVAYADVTLDPQECYRIRDLTIAKEDARIYLTEGYLILSRPVGDTRPMAVFSADVEAGDGEILIMPPNRSERRALATYTGAPNLSEHISVAIMLFGDDTYQELKEQLVNRKKSPEMGVLLEQRWGSVAQSIATSFESRLQYELKSHQKPGYFAAVMTGKKLGNFDLVYDPLSPEQIAVGRMSTRADHHYFDIWTSFESRSHRNGANRPKIEMGLADFRIDSTLDPALILHVTTKVQVTPSEATVRVLPFDLANTMTVSSATIDGKPAELLQRESPRTDVLNTGNRTFLVLPPEPLQSGRAYTVEIRSEGQVAVDRGNHVYYVGARGNWYPNRGLQLATYDLTFRYPRELDLVAPGEIVSDKTDADIRVTQRRTGVKIRMAGFNLGHYQRERVKGANAIVEVFANRDVERALQPRPEPVLAPPPAPLARPRRGEPERPPITLAPALTPNPASGLRRLAADVEFAIDFFTARFGPPPLRNISITPIPGTFGQGFPGLIYISTLAYLDNTARPIASLSTRNQMFFAEQLVVHEVAHQWWGNIVFTTNYHDEWLMEALANYSAMMYLEKNKGAKLFDEMLAQYRDELLAKSEAGATVEASGPIVLGTRLTGSLAPQAWRAITYGKGSWIMHMLRRRMGDEAFLKLLAALRKEYEFRPITTEEFRLLAARFLPPNSADAKLEAFFDQWVYGTGIPTLKLSHSLKGLKVTGTIKVSDVPEDFNARVPIEVQFRGAKPITQWIPIGAEDATFTIPVRQPPLKVLLDPANAVLKR